MSLKSEIFIAAIDTQVHITQVHITHYTGTYRHSTQFPDCDMNEELKATKYLFYEVFNCRD